MPVQRGRIVQFRHRQARILGQGQDARRDILQGIVRRLARRHGELPRRRLVVESQPRQHGAVAEDERRRKQCGATESAAAQSGEGREDEGRGQQKRNRPLKIGDAEQQAEAEPCGPVHRRAPRIARIGLQPPNQGDKGCHRAHYEGEIQRLAEQCPGILGGRRLKREEQAGGECLAGRQGSAKGGV